MLILGDSFGIVLADERGFVFGQGNYGEIGINGKQLVSIYEIEEILVPN